VRPDSQFLHSCVCELFIYSHDRSAYPAAGKYMDRWESINLSQTHECGNWESGRAVPRKGINKWDFRCSVVLRVSLLTDGPAPGYHGFHGGLGGLVSLDNLQQLNLPMARPQEIMASIVTSEVWSALTTSSSFITGTGLKKWRPPTRSCLFTSYIKIVLKGQLSIWLYGTVVCCQ
jgi:hypothetical protein